MPPKTVFSKEDVIQAAFEVVQKVGLDQGLRVLSARRVAEKLGSSTAPVYSYFKSMNELSREVVRRARQLYFEYADRSYTDKAYLNMQVGLVLYAKEQRELFLRSMFFERDELKDIASVRRASTIKEVAKDPRLSRVSPGQIDDLASKMHIFAQGLATMVCFGLFEDASLERIIETLSDATSGFIDSIEKGRRHGFSS